MDIQESSCEDNIKFNFLGIIWESKRSWGAHFQAFREPKIQNLATMVPTLKYTGFIFFQISRFELLGDWNVSQPTQRRRQDVVKTSYFWSQRRLRLV